jgi:Tol biopolymer transport system component
VGPQAWAHDATVALLTDVPTEHRGVPTGKDNVLVARSANGDITELDRIQTGAQTYQSSFIPIDWLPDRRLLTLLLLPAQGAATDPNDDPASGQLVAYPLSGEPEVIHDFDCLPSLRYSPTGLENPSLSPDKQHFAWAGGCYDKTDRGELWVLDITTGKAQQLAGSSWIGDYEWSPDGQDIAYSQLSEEGTYEYVNSGIFVVSADGGTHPPN